MDQDLAQYVKKKALDEGALLVGYTKIRKTEPVIVFGFPFSEGWFLRHPLKISRLLGKDHLVSKHVQNITAQMLQSEGYRVRLKTIWSVYGDFRPLAVAAGLGEWGKNGIVVNKDFGSGLLFAALFTDAPLPVSGETQGATDPSHCKDCGGCREACPANAFAGAGFFMHKCLAYCMRGCAECITACSKKLH
ncbi:MAG: 4Fe-4S ferredoxin [Bacillota bacterium]|nr:4Fe-4S ferredoxin [Bacillota bacterium]